MPGPERWLADEQDLSTMAWNVSGSVTSVPGLRGSDLTLPMRDGVIHVPNRSAEVGELTLNMWVLGAESDGSVPSTRSARRGLFEKNLHRLLAILTNRSSTIRIRRYMPDGIGYREAECVWSASTSVSTMMARQRAEFTVLLDIVDSYWKSSTRVTDTVTGSTEPLLLSFPDAAGMSAPVLDAVVTVKGPAYNPKVVNLESGVWVSLANLGSGNGSLDAGDTWVIDSGAWTSKVNGANQPVKHGGHPRYVYIAPRSGLFSLPRLQLESDTSGATTSLSATFYPRWATL